MKKNLSLFLAMFMMMSVLFAGCGIAPAEVTQSPKQSVGSSPATNLKEQVEDYDYTHYRAHSQFPLSKDTPIRIAVRRDDTYGADWDKTWFWNWMKEKSGLEFVVEQLLSRGYV